MKIYIAGKVTGVDKEVYTKVFKDAEIEMRMLGYITFNPVEICEEKGLTKWNECMNECLKYLLDADTCYFTKGYEDSEGARVEYYLAEKLGKEIIIQVSKYDKFTEQFNQHRSENYKSERVGCSYMETLRKFDYDTYNEIKNNIDYNCFFDNSKITAFKRYLENKWSNGELI